MQLIMLYNLPLMLVGLITAGELATTVIVLLSGVCLTKEEPWILICTPFFSKRGCLSGVVRMCPPCIVARLLMFTPIGVLELCET